MNNYLLNLKNLKENIDLKSKAGLVCIRRAMAGSDEVILVADDRFNDVNQTFKPLPLLTLFLNKGIDIKAQITHGDSYTPYPFDYEIGLLDGKNYDEQKFEQFFSKLNALCKSKTTQINRKGRKIANLLHIYQNAHLLIPKFYDESYLNLLRILDAQAQIETSNAILFPNWIIKILLKGSKKFMKKIFQDIASIKVFQIEHLPLAMKLFKSKKKEFSKPQFAQHITLSNYSEDCMKFLYSILYVLYEYRNKYIHEAFLLPHKIQARPRRNELEGLSYLDASFGESHMLTYDPEKGSESIDVHKILRQTKKKGSKKPTGKDFQDYYLLLPTWHLLNLIVRRVLFYRLNNL